MEFASINKLFIRLIRKQLLEQTAEHTVPQCQPAISAKTHFCKSAFTL